MAKLVSLTHAERDQDHIPVIVCNLPQAPDRSAAILANNDAPLPFMLDGVRALERAGADLLAIPCNSAHHWYDALARATDRHVLHIVDAVRAELDPDPTASVALLATRGAVASGFYQRQLAGAVREVITPDADGQAEIDALIAAVKSGEAGAGRGLTVLEQLLARGAQRIILACTELPIAFAGAPLEDRCVDATAALARACIRGCGGKLRTERDAEAA